MNTNLLRDVQDAILDHPEHFDMRDWFYPHPTDCGTTACIAGWAVSIHYNTTPTEVAQKRDPANYFLSKHSQTQSFSSIARDILDIDSPAQSLFLHWEWHDPYDSAYHNAIEKDNHVRAAHIAAHYITLWVNHHSEETPMDYPNDEPDLYDYLDNLS